MRLSFCLACVWVRKNDKGVASLAEKYRIPTTAYRLATRRAGREPALPSIAANLGASALVTLLVTLKTLGGRRELG